MLVSTDDATYVYIQPLDSAKYEYKSGYATFTGEFSALNIGESALPPYEVFSGLFLAD